MGTMIQRYKLTEADFRGERFANHPRDLQGRQRRARPHAARRHQRDPSRVSRRRRRHHRDEHVRRHHDRAGRLRARGRSSTTSTSKGRGSRERPPTSGPRRRPTGRASSPAPSGPTNRTLSISPDVNNPALPRHDVRRDARGLRDAGARPASTAAPTSSCSRRSSTRSAPRPRIVAIENVFEETGVRLPLMISVTITDRSGRTLSGQTLDAFYVSIRHARPFSVGINCALGARDMRPYLAELARIAECYVSSYPNAGLPERVRRVRRAAGRDRRAAARLRRPAASSTSSAAAAARRRSTSRPLPRRWRACAAAAAGS